MFLHNVTLMNNDTLDQTQLFYFHLVELNEISSSISLHCEIHPLIDDLSYLFIYHFDRFPPAQINGWTFFFPSPFSLDVNNLSL